METLPVWCSYLHFRDGGETSWGPWCLYSGSKENDVLQPGSTKLFLQNESQVTEYHSPDGSREGYKTGTLRWNMHLIHLTWQTSFPHGSAGKESGSNKERHRRHRFNPWIREIPWRGKFHNPLQYSCLKNLMKRSLMSYRPEGCRRVGPDWAHTCTRKLPNILS